MCSCVFGNTKEKEKMLMEKVRQCALYNFMLNNSNQQTVMNCSLTPYGQQRLCLFYHLQFYFHFVGLITSNTIIN